MVHTPDAFVHGQSPIKHNQPVVRRNETIESIKHALAAKGIDYKQPVAFVTLDDNGNVHVHASGQVKGFLDEHQVQSGFKEVWEQAVHGSLIFPEPTSAISIDTDQGSDFGGDEFPPIPRASGAAQSRVWRPTRQRSTREQSLLPCSAPRHCPAESRPFAEHMLHVSSPPSEPDEEVMPRKKMSRSMRIGDEAEVVDFLKTRLKRMQQLAVKKIAKAWIKGICPKKQAKFPYQNKKCEEFNGFKPRIPGWWPKQGCRFTEPDHIKRDERMTLCIHLLRLRPTPAQLKEWNEDKSDPHPTHLLHGWTAFLEELAGTSVFDDLQKQDKRKTESKKELLRELYEVATMEEDFVNGGIDADTTHAWWEDEEDRKPVLTKRHHQDLVDFKTEEASRHSSESIDCKRMKWFRQDSKLDRDVQKPSIAQPSNARTIGAPPGEDCQQVEPSSVHSQSEQSPQELERTSGPIETFIPRVPVYDQCGAAPMKQESSTDSRWHQFQPHQGFWVENSVAGHGFEGPSSHFANFQGGPSSPSRLNSHQGYTYPQQQEHPHMVQVHEVRHVPDPQFQATQNVPMYSPEGMMPAPLSHFIPPEYTATVPSSQPFTNAMTPDQYLMPATIDMVMGDFQSQMQHPYCSQHGLAERHIASMQVHGLPFTQPTCWEGRRFTSHGHNPT